MSDEERPSPESLLAQAAASERKAGRLKIFLGAAPGVGKTFTMLEQAHARRRAGGDVVVGVVETHGRTETAAQLAGLPLLPRRRVDQRGVTLHEFDLDGALARQPALLLVDELAHDNAPGSRHLKRWQDLLELLDAGIDVFTTLNVQHVESVHDVVQQLTGVDVRERVPDELIERADEIELVDLPTDELLERLRAGRIYAGEGAVRAAAGFFQAATLAGLRELALRLVADRVRATAPAPTRRATGGKLLVGIGASPFAPRLLRTAKRFADALGCEWLAVHVAASPGHAASDGEQRRLGNHLRLAESLGAEVHTLPGRDVADELLACARRLDVRWIVVGKPLAASLARRFTPPLADELLRRSGAIDVIAVNGAASDEPEPEAAPRRRRDPLGWLLAVVAIGAATGASALLRGVLAPVNLCLIYLLAVMAVAFRGARGPAAFASLLGVALFDLFFVPPYGTFTVADSQYVLTFLAMLCVGLFVSTQAARLRATRDGALREAERSAALHRLSEELAARRGVAELCAAAQRRGEEALGVPVRVLVLGARSGAPALEEPVREATRAPLADAEFAVARWVADHGEPAGAGTATLPGAAGLHLPLSGKGGVVGVLIAEGLPAERFAEPQERRFLESIGRALGMALEVERLAERASAAAVEAASERLRSALLASVSHDLRTPLQVIVGSATALAEAQALLDPATRAELAQGIADEAERMGQTVTNLLDVTRLEGGAAALRKQPHDVEDLFGTALAALERRLAGRPTEVVVAPDFPAVAVDPVLFQSVLVNLIDNAIHYTPSGTPITLAAVPLDGGARVELSVADRGPGLAADEQESVFEKFTRGTARAASRGVGLGLTIARRIVEAHGGTIRARARLGGGAEFAVVLPAAPPAAAAREE